MRIIFRDLNYSVCAAVSSAFCDVQEFDIACGDIFSAGAADAIISPANSHGWMDGGIDLAYVRRWGNGLQGRLMAKIKAEHNGLLPVGAALAVETGANDIPWMISAPTMKVPMPVPNTLNAYYSFRAALAVAAARGFSAVLCPGLATLTGRMSPTDSAEQMRKAWDEFCAAIAQSAPNAPE